MMVKVRVMKGSAPPSMENGILIVHTSKERRNNIANLDIVRQLSTYFNIPTSVIRLVSGMKSKSKIFSIPDL